MENLISDVMMWPSGGPLQFTNPLYLLNALDFGHEDEYSRSMLCNKVVPSTIN